MAEQGAKTLAARSESDWGKIKRELKAQALILAAIVALLWLVEVVDLVLGGALDSFGVHPRRVAGLPGILLAPFLHGGFRHLAANTGPLIVLGWFIMLWSTRQFFWVWLVGTIIGGVGVWLTGATGSVHIGASIVVFAFLGYLLTRGWFERRVLSIIGSIVVGLLYGGLLFGVLPGQPGVSWQGHLFGFAGGVVAAWLVARSGRSGRAAAK